MLVMVQGSEDVLFGKIQKNHWMAVEVWIFIHLAFFWGWEIENKGQI